MAASWLLLLLLCCDLVCHVRGETEGVNLEQSDFDHIKHILSKTDVFSKIESKDKALLEGDLKLDGATSVNDWILKNVKWSNGHAAATHGRQWPNGEIPFTVSKKFTKDDRAAVAAAVKEFDTKTSGCIKWRAKTDGDTDYVYIAGSGGESCYATHVGYRKGSGQHYINLGTYCRTTGVIVHEMLHILGFFHEQSRPDRDNYVTIRKENIADGLEYNFEAQKKDIIDHFGEPYDYKSIMHYSEFAFSKNGRKTIEAKNGNVIKRGSTLSQGDVNQLKKMYSCQSAATTTATPMTSSTVTSSTMTSSTTTSSTGITSTPRKRCVDKPNVDCKMLSGNGYCAENMHPRIKAFLDLRCCQSCYQARKKPGPTGPTRPSHDDPSKKPLPPVLQKVVEGYDFGPMPMRG